MIRNILNHFRKRNITSYAKNRTKLIEDNVYIGNNVIISENVHIGRYTHVNRNSEIITGDKNTHIIIGRFCAVAPETVIRTDNHTPHRATISNEVNKLCNINIPSNEKVKGPIEIGNDVWIGQKSIILSNVKIGDGAVIAAGSVVTKDVNAYEIVGGVPSRHIKYRFRPDIIEQLLSIKWWNWSPDRIKRNKDFFEVDLTKLKDNIELRDFIK